jgi:hypothetical protein
MALRKVLTVDQAVRIFGFKDVTALDIFGLEIDGMMQYMRELQGKAIEPEMIGYIDKNFTDPRMKIFAGMYVGAKLNEQEWLHHAAHH